MTCNNIVQRNVTLHIKSKPEDEVRLMVIYSQHAGSSLLTAGLLRDSGFCFTLTCGLKSDNDKWIGVESNNEPSSCFWTLLYVLLPSGKELLHQPFSLRNDAIMFIPLPENKQHTGKITSSSLGHCQQSFNVKRKGKRNSHLCCNYD